MSTARKFEYFLFENFDATKETHNPGNPRTFLGAQTDAILSEIAAYPANTCPCSTCIKPANSDLIQKMISGGILRQYGTAFAFASPVFLKEDAAVLHKCVASKSRGLADMLEKCMPAIRLCCDQIKNGTSIEQNLYHIICAMVFDGYFLDYLSKNGALSASRQHPSGLDYLTVIYEKCSELQTLSNRLLCSYNRLANSECSLQSFGDANGDRFDFYRYFRLMEQGALPAKFKAASALLGKECGTFSKDALLSEARALVKTGQCAPTALKILELFGYAKNGAVCVPVYTPDHREHILQINGIVESCLGEALIKTLYDLSVSVPLTAVRHGVDPMEISNELYHIVFGSINEELVSRGIVTAPQHIPGEGRYCKCIEINV